MPKTAPNGVALVHLKDRTTGEVITRYPVDAREIMASDADRYVIVDEHGAPVATLEAATAVTELLTGKPHEFGQAIITASVGAAGDLVVQLLDSDADQQTKRDSLARALELEEASKARKTVIELLRDAQKQVG
jgi:hypothetical protein